MKSEHNVALSSSLQNIELIHCNEDDDTNNKSNKNNNDCDEIKMRIISNYNNIVASTTSLSSTTVHEK